MVRLLRQLSLPYLRASWGRTALVVGGVATGVALMVAINVLNTSVMANFQRSMALLAGPADLQIALGLGEIGFPEATAETVARDPDVAIAVPLVRGTIALADAPAEALQLFGTDLTAEERLPRYEIDLVTDRQAASDVIVDLRSVLVPRALAASHGISVGDTVRIATPRGIEALTVRGLLQARGLAAAFGGRLAVMDLTAAQRLLDKDGRIDQIDVVLRPGADRQVVERRLAGVLPPGLTVAPPAHRVAIYETVLASVRAMLTGLSVLCLIAGAYIVYNTTSTGAIERSLTMAQLRFVGAGARQLFNLLMLETLLLAIVGAALGEVYGLGLAYALRGTLGVGYDTIFQHRVALDDLTVDRGDQTLIVLLGIATALLASYSAARRVRTLDPLQVLHRSAPAATGWTGNPRRLVVVWLVMVIASAAAFAAEVAFKSYAWGNVGSTFWNASAFAIAVPLVAWAARRLQVLLPRLFGPAGRFAAESVLRAPTRAGTTVAAIALVLTVSVTLASLSESFRRSVTVFVGEALGGDLVVSAVTTEGGWLETPLPEHVGADLAAIDGVRAVETVRVLPGQPYRGQRIGILALSDGLLASDRLPPQWYRQGDPRIAEAALKAGRGVNISLSLADWAGLKVGDRVALDTPTGPLDLPVMGVVPDYTADKGTVIVGRRLLVERWQEPTVSRFMLFLDDDTTVETVRSRILALLGPHFRLKVDSLRDAVAYITGKIDDAFGFTDAIQLLIAIVTAAGIFDLLLSAIAERRRELALWRIIGADEGMVRRAVVIESGTLGALGVLLGAGFGYVTAALWVRINYRYLLGFFLDFHFAYHSAALSFALVVAMAMAAGWLASLTATRAPILSGVRAD